MRLMLLEHSIDRLRHDRHLLGVHTLLVVERSVA
jgi:hypothetical protein